jgi:uncharacterized phage protein (TIGR01671 family)
MKNQLSFRIWDKALNKWTEDYVPGTHAFTETYISLSGDVVKFSAGFSERDEQPVFSKEADSSFHSGKWWRDEERYVVQRGAGLTDINGREIYEGDFVRYEGEEIGQRAGFVKEPIVFEWGSFRANGYPIENFIENEFSAANNSCSLEIVGNIFENPELI